MAKHHGGRYYINVAQDNGLVVKNGNGDHYKAYGTLPDGTRTMMTIPNHRELANGTECTIRKWFIRLGIVVVLSGCVVLMGLTLIAGLVQH